MRNFHFGRSRGIMLAGVALAFSAQNAGAQTVPPPVGDEAPSEGEIVVTAQKREQRLLDVPVPVTAVDASTLIQQNLVTLSDFYARVPGLQYSGERTSQISLRGITTGGQTNPTVAILVDDVPFGSSTYLGNGTFPDFDPATLDRIEVLRGPQGTLYGASSLGGLIKYVTRTPDTNSFSGRIEFGASTIAHGGEGFSARGSVNVPILADRAALSISGFYRRPPAYVDNIVGAQTREDASRSKNWGGRAALLLQPVDALAITLSAMKQRNDFYGRDQITIASGTDFTAVDGRPGPTRGSPIGDFATTSSFGAGRTDFELYSARAVLDLGFADLTSVSAWGRTDRSDILDVTNVFGFLGLAYPGLTRVDIDDSSSLRKFSQEVRLSGSGDRFDWLVGGFYTKERANLPQTLIVQSATLTDKAVYVGEGPSRYSETAGFADLTWHVTPEFDIQVGGRYSENRQRYDSVTTVDGPATMFLGPSSSDSSNGKAHAFTWLITPSYHITPDTMLYARVAKGYRPGGQNAIVLGIPPTFDSDTVINYEAGIKGVAFDKLLTYDVSAFWIDWKNIQLNAIAPAGFSYYLNGPRARSRGIEATVRLAPWTGFAVDANGTYTEAELTSDLPASTPTVVFPAGRKGDRLPQTPKFSANLSVQQDFQLSDSVSAFVGATYTYYGERRSAFVTGGAVPRVAIPSYSNVDLRGGISIDGDWQLNLFVRNLFDRRGVVTVANAPAPGAFPSATFLRPRTIGFTVSGAF